ncbi:MAG: Hpt domain-containing protein [Spirochaetes bacterium]|nr:Hpt domain-containing protein [Spirochaetota bacterium]
MQILIDELRLIELKKLFARTHSHQLHEFVRAFKDTAKSAVEILVNAPHETELETLRVEAHRLKGASLNIGAPALAELAASLEAGARSGDRTAFTAQRETIISLHENTVAELNDTLRKIVL